MAPAHTIDTPPSRLLLNEAFAKGSPALLDELLRRAWPSGPNERALLHTLVDRWYDDPRPALRSMLFEYVREGVDKAGHRVLVKGLFKRAEAAGDDALLAAFARAFDGLARRVVRVRKGYHFERATRQYHPVERKRLVAPPGRVRAVGNTKRALSLAVFTTATRTYLARRALRYFRTLGRKHPERFVPAVAALLGGYEGAQLARPEQVLDAWTLLHLCFYRSPVLRWDPRGLRVQPGRALHELAPAPMYPQLWREHGTTLLELVVGARSHTVRQWAATLAQTLHGDAVRALPFEKLRALLLSPHEPARQLAAAFFADASFLHTLSLEAWFELLATDDPLVLSTVCEQFERIVRPERLSLARCVELACARPTPLAELGARWLETRVVQAPKADELALLLALARAPCAPVRTRLAPWLAAHVNRSAAATWHTVRDLLDAPYAEVRAAAMALLSEGRFADETGLWSALAESPYDDARDFLVVHLEERLPALERDALRFVWATALLAVRRGGRTRARVLAQLAKQLVAEPESASEVLPLLRIALRSVRAPERRAALAALTRGALAHPSLRATFATALPELELFALDDEDGAAPTAHHPPTDAASASAPRGPVS